MSEFHFENFSFPLTNLTSSMTLDAGGLDRLYVTSFPRASTVSSRRIVYRGVIAGDFVYSVNVLPVGASDIVVIGEIE